VLVYNAVAYPVCVGIACRLVAPVFIAWRTLERSGAVAEAHRRALKWPLRVVPLACAGWLPGGLIFPMVLAARSTASAPIGLEVFGHFLVSFWISGLIAMTYSYFGVESIALRVAYPRLWAGARGLRATMAAELEGRESRLAAFQLLSSLIPLSGAAMLIGLGPEDMSRTSRTLIGALIVLGMAGIGLTHSAARLLSRTLTALAGTEGRTRSWTRR
jgi:hypothetical protein